MRQQFAGFAPPAPVVFEPRETRLGLGDKLLLFLSTLQREERALCTPKKSGGGRVTSQIYTPGAGEGGHQRLWGWEEQLVPNKGQDSSLGPQQAQRHLGMEQGQGWSCGSSIPLLLPMALHPKGEPATPAHPPDRGRWEGPSPVKLQSD